MNKSNNRRLRIHKSDGKVLKRRNKKNVSGRKRGRVQIYGDAGRQALRDINALRRFVNAEIHYTDAIGNAVASTSTAAFVLLNGLSTGDTMTTRTGQSVKCDGMDFKFIITGNAAAIPLYERILVVADKQTNAAIFAIGELLNATTVTSMYTVGNQSRFQVLYDESFSLVPGSESYAITRALKLPAAGIHTMFNTGNAGTVADIVSLSIYLIHFSDQAVNNSSFSYYSRFWFLDN